MKSDDTDRTTTRAGRFLITTPGRRAPKLYQMLAQSEAAARQARQWRIAAIEAGAREVGPDELVFDETPTGETMKTLEPWQQGNPANLEDARTVAACVTHCAGFTVEQVEAVALWELVVVLADVAGNGHPGARALLARLGDLPPPRRAVSRVVNPRGRKS